MKLTLVITGLAMGGAENQVVNLADTLASRGHKVTLAYILRPEFVLPHNRQVKLVWLGGRKSIFGIMKAYINLARLVRVNEPDLLHSHMFHANILSRLLRLIIKVPRLICTAHNINEGSGLRMLAYRVTDNLADEFTNVSSRAVKAFEEKKAAPRGRMIVTFNGIDTKRFSFDPVARNKLRSELDIQSCKVFIAVGRFHEQKDYPNLLDAFSLLAARHPESHLLIVGDGELRPMIEQKIEALGLNGRVDLLGVRNDIPELMSAADIFVLSSASEGFGLVIAEAMACERIVIATNSGGVSEVLGGNGFLVPPKDSTALAESMAEAIKMPSDVSKENGLKCRRYICENYSLQAAVLRWEEIYQKPER